MRCGVECECWTNRRRDGITTDGNRIYAWPGVMSDWNFRQTRVCVLGLRVCFRIPPKHPKRVSVDASLSSVAQVTYIPGTYRACTEREEKHAPPIFRRKKPPEERRATPCGPCRIASGYYTEPSDFELAFFPGSSRSLTNASHWIPIGLSPRDPL